MDIIGLIFLPVILLLGIITSYQDIKYGKIKNKWIISAIIYALVAYIFVTVIYKISNISINYNYFVDVIINLFIACLAGFLLWNFKFWSAADGKLFIAYSALLPLTLYSNFYIKYFPSFIIAINTFVPFLIFALFIFIMNTKDQSKNLSTEFKKTKKSEILILPLNIFWIMWIPILIGFLKVNIDFLTSLIIVMILAIGLQKLFNKKIILVSLFLCILRILFDRTVFTQVFLKQFIIYSLFIIAIFFIIKFSSVMFIHNVKISQLKPGMVLVGKIGKKDKKYTLLESGELNNYKKQDLLSVNLEAEGLTIQDINKIKKLQEQGKLNFSSARVHQTLPFAPFIFFGVLLTLIAKGNFFIFLKAILTKSL